MTTILKKLKKNKKVILAGLVATTGAASAIGITAGLLSNKNQYETTGNNSSDSKSNSFNMTLSTGTSTNTSTGTGSTTTNPTTPEETKPENKSYHLTIVQNTQDEGVIQFITSKENGGFEISNEVMFKPSETIYVGIQLNAGYEDYTAREIKIYAGENQSIYLTAQRVPNWNLKNLFEIKMPSYEETVNKETGKSWLYNEDTSVNVAATFIKESIGTNGNDVNWDQGAMNNSMPGYVYELSGDTTWTAATEKIYEAFENKDINKPIDIYFFLNGYTLTFDVDLINLDIKSGWALHFYNNKIDRRNPTTGRYGEIRVAGDKKPMLKIQGAAVFGSSVKFKYMIASDGIWFENFENKNAVGGQENDPEVRLSAIDPKPSTVI